MPSLLTAEQIKERIRLKIAEKQGYKQENDGSDSLSPKKRFILVSADFSGLGFAKQEIDRGGEVLIAYKPKEELKPDEKKAYEVQGNGICDKIELNELMNKRNEYKDWYWIWDGNHNWKENEQLKSEGFKVVLGGELAYNLENDREFGAKFAQSVGLELPETFDFTSLDDGIKFLEEHEDEAFVFKPNGISETWLTYIPIAEDETDANLELIGFLDGIHSFNIKEFILQRKIKGVEINVEGFCQNGEFVYAHANFENKKSYTNDTGEASGCAFDVEFTIPLSSKLFQLTAGKFSKKIRELNYTGFVDTNVIIGEYQQVYFLEFCFRVGYNAHPNLFFNLFEKDFLQTMADLYDKNFDPKVKDGFGASLTMFTNHNHIGLPIYVPESVENKFYLFDGYEKDDKLFMGGLDYKEIGVVMSHDYTIENALKSVVSNAEKVIFSNRYARWDANESKDTPLGIKRRYEAILAMGLLN